MSAQVAADLRAAAEVLRRNGWIQGRMFSPGGECCVVGAIYKATGGGLADVCARVAFYGYLDRAAAEWNDEPGRTADEVIAALQAAADDEAAS